MRSLRDDRGMRNRSGQGSMIRGGVHNSNSNPHFHPQQQQQQQQMPPPPQNQQNMPQPPQQQQQQQQQQQVPPSQQQQQQPSPGMIPPPQQQQNNHHQHPAQNNHQQAEQYTPPPQQQSYQRSPAAPQSLQQRNDPNQFDQAKVHQYLSEKWLSAKQRSEDMSIPEKDRPKIYVSQHNNQWGQGHIQNVHQQSQNVNIEQLIRKKLDEKKRGSLSQQNSLELEKEKLPNGTPASQHKGKWR